MIGSILTNNGTTNGTIPGIPVNLTHTDELIISIVAMVIGLAMAFMGRKLFKATMFVAGFIGVGGATYYVMQTIAIHNDSIHFSKVVSLAVPVAAGFIGGCVVIGIVKLGFFLAGAAVGAVIAFMIFSVVGAHFGTHAFIIRIVIVGVLALLCGAITVQQEKRLIILITSLGGSYMAFAGADHFVKSGYVQAMHSLLLDEKNIIPSASHKLLAMFGGTIALAVFGFIVQFITNKKKRAGWEEDEYLLSRKVNY